MSVVCDVKCKPGAELPGGRFCLVKGSPEAVEQLLRKEDVPAWYSASYNDLAEEGMRVLALAYKPIPSSTDPTDEVFDPSICFEHR